MTNEFTSWDELINPEKEVENITIDTDTSYSGLGSTSNTFMYIIIGLVITLGAAGIYTIIKNGVG